jgi:hypothetical protein
VVVGFNVPAHTPPDRRRPAEVLCDVIGRKGAGSEGNLQGRGQKAALKLAKRVGPPPMKVLFGIYHVQIMDGDVVRRIRQPAD